MVLLRHTLSRCTVKRFLNFEIGAGRTSLIGYKLWLDEIQTRAPNEHVHAFKARVQEAVKVLL